VIQFILKSKLNSNEIRNNYLPKISALLLKLVIPASILGLNLSDLPFLDNYMKKWNISMNVANSIKQLVVKTHHP